MHISHADLRSDAQCITTYTSASVLGLQANCAILRNPYSQNKEQERSQP